MSQHNADQAASDCRRRAEVLLHLADFIAARCARIDCLCAHADASLHVYDEDDALAEFGTGGWQFKWTTESGEDRIGKTVDGVNITFQVRKPHAFTPSLPLL